MLCYGDMTFCSYYEDCAKTDCPRALTDDIQYKAQAHGLPICQFVDKPLCWRDKTMASVSVDISS